MHLPVVFVSGIWPLQCDSKLHKRSLAQVDVVDNLQQGKRLALVDDHF